MSDLPRTDLPAPASPAALLAAQALRFGDHDLFVLPQGVADLWSMSRTSWTYAEAEAEVAARAARFAAAGYGPGHRVALLLENRPQHFFIWLALNRLGASVVPVNPDYTRDELHYLLDHSEAVLAVTLAGREAQLRAAADPLGVPVVLDALEALPAAPRPATAAPTDTGGAECVVLYTSGTTGRPKGCLLSNRYFLAWGEWYVAQDGVITLREGQERLMTPLPAFHVNAIGNSFIGMLMSGGAQVIVDRFHPRSWWAMAVETRATCFHYLGVMPAILLNLPESPEEKAHGFRFGMGGGVHPDHHAAFEARFGVPLVEGWAMTEGGGATILTSSSGPRHVGSRCIGRADRPGPALELRIADPSGAPVPPGTPGEMLLRASGADPKRAFFSGYLKNDAATAAAWEGGWLHTGDVVVEWEDGTLHFVERLKNIIRRSGENIAAMEVEAALAADPMVAQVAVVATSDPFREEEVMAIVALKPGQAADAAAAQALFDRAARSLAYFKLPGYLAFVDALPTTSTQKIRKADLGPVVIKPLEHGAFDFREAKQALRPKGKAAH